MHRRRDDRTRFADARGPKSYADSSPITRAFGKKSSITRRRVKNDWFNHAGCLWAFASLRASTGTNAHYRWRLGQRDWPAVAQRNRSGSSRQTVLIEIRASHDASAMGPGRTVARSAYSRLRRWDVTS